MQVMDNGPILVYILYFVPKMPPPIRWSVQIVRPESSTTLGYLGVEAIPLHENHINMVKFSSMEGQGFQEISEQLQKMAKDVLKGEAKDERCKRVRRFIGRLQSRRRIYGDYKSPHDYFF